MLRRMKPISFGVAGEWFGFCRRFAALHVEGNLIRRLAPTATCYCRFAAFNFLRQGPSGRCDGGAGQSDCDPAGCHCWLAQQCNRDAGQGRALRRILKFKNVAAIFIDNENKQRCYSNFASNSPASRPGAEFAQSRCSSSKRRRAAAGFLASRFLAICNCP